MENAETNQSRRKSKRVDAVTNLDTEGRQNIRQGKTLFFSILCSLLVGGLAVTDQSLWMDEASSAVKAVQPSLASWWTTFVIEKGSDLQMPFYMFYLWAWCKAFGMSEIALRSANLPWFAAGVCALLWGFARNRRLQLAITVLTLINAFLWYYISEARPYIVLFAFSALSAACLFHLRENQERSIKSPFWFRFFCLGIVGICATNLIAVPWALAAIGAFMFWIGPRLALQTVRRFIWSVALTACVLITLAVFYCWTLRPSGHAFDVGRTRFTTLGFVFYELLGILGLGPSRLALRESGTRALAGYLPEVSLGVLAALFLCVAGASQLRKKATTRDLILCGIIVGLPSVVAIGGAEVTHFRILGRHFMPLVPLILALQATGLRRLLFDSSVLLRAIALAGCVVLLISALEIRFAPRHRRDDYRAAVAETRQAIGRGKKVWWVADEVTGRYYNLPLSSANLLSVKALSPTDLDGVQQPDLIVFSKPDIYDPSGNITVYLLRHDFKVTEVLPAFQIFEKNPTPR